MSGILEIFDQKGIIDYLKDRVYPTYMGKELFVEEKRDELKFDELSEGSNIPVIASVHSFDSEAEIGTREAQERTIELALIKRKMQLKEEEIIKILHPRTNQEKKRLINSVYNDIDNLVLSVMARVELMRMEIVAKGKVTLSENNLTAVLDYGVPEEHRAANVDWNKEDSDPISDITTWYNKLGTKPERIITSNVVLAKLTRHPNVVAALYGNGAKRVATVGELNTYLESLGLPKIYTNDDTYRKQKADGKYEVKRFFPENCFSMIPGGNLGKTIYGPTAEEIRLSTKPGIDVESIGNILAMVYEEGTDPVSTWEKAVATALPSLNCADKIFQAEIKLAD